MNCFQKFVIYFVCDKGLESLFVLFNLDTGISLRKFGVFLPCPVNDISVVIERLSKKFETEKTFTLDMYPWEQDDNKYLENIDNIKGILGWIEARKKYER